jgi:hypothetical protein
MRVSLLLTALALTFSSQAHAIGIDWSNFSCSGGGADVFNETSYAGQFNLKRINGYREDREVKLVISKEAGGASTFLLDRVEDEIDSLGRVTLVYENKRLKLKIKYEGEAGSAGIELLQRKKAKDLLVLRANCASD